MSKTYEQKSRTQDLPLAPLPPLTLVLIVADPPLDGCMNTKTKKSVGGAECFLPFPQNIIFIHFSFRSLVVFGDIDICSSR